MRSAEFLKPQLEQLGFLELRKTVDSGVVQLPKGLELPLLSSTLRQTLQTGAGSFKTEDIVLGILLLYGLDAEFPDKSTYREILEAIEQTTGSLVPFIAELTKHNPVQALIAGLGYQHLQLPDERAEIVTIEAANLAQRESGDDRYEALAYDLLVRAAEHSDAWQISYHLGYLFYNRDQFSEAIKWFDQALTHDLPTEFSDELLQMIELSRYKADYERGLQLLFNERPQEALEIFESLRPDFPQWYELHFYTGLAYRLEQQYSQALSAFYEALNLKQDDANLYNELSICHIMHDDPEPALKHLELALSLDPDHPELLTNHGIVLYQLDQIEPAIESLERAEALQPEDPLIKQWLNQVREVTED